MIGKSLMEDFIKEELKNIVSEIRFDEPMKDHTTFRVGGPAEVFACPTLTELPGLIRFLSENNINYIVTGNGSNLLVSDNGIRGIVINIGKNFSEKSIVTESKDSDSEVLIIPAGTLLSEAAHEALTLSLSGMEELSGIPGTIGGAVFMNAGAYDREMKDIVSSVESITLDGETHVYKASDLSFSYRHTIFMDSSRSEQGFLNQEIITVVHIILHSGNKDEIKNSMMNFSSRRREKQPLEYPSAGSTFKRPECYFAGKLIEDVGLKGFSIGGAEVSEKHAGFIINKGNATARDIYDLISEVRKRVFEKSGVELEPEVRMLGEF